MRLSLTHLDPDMVKFLHSKQLSEVRIGLFFVVLDVVDVFQPEVFQFFLELLDNVLELLHAIGVLFNEFLDGLDFQVDCHLNGSE